MTDLDRLVADGRITDEDAAAVLKFRDFLRQVGPLIGPLTEAQRAFRQHCRTDPEWREYLGLDDGQATP